MRQDKRTRQANMIDRAIKERTRHIVLDNLHKPDPLGAVVSISRAYGNVPVYKGRVRVCRNHVESVAKGANPAISRETRQEAKRLAFAASCIDSGMVSGDVHSMFNLRKA